MSKRFTDKVILVTGGTSGIGLATCKRLISEGAKVMVHGLRREDASATARLLGRRARGVSGDLKSPKTCDRIVAATVKAFGRIDGLVNNAGIYPRHTIEQADAEVFDLLFHVNTRAPLLTTRAAILAFRAQGTGGSVVSIGSLNGWSGLSELTVYSMSKGALMTMTRNLADTLGPERMRFTCLNVGWVGTEQERITQIAQGQPPDWMEKVPRWNAPIGRIQTPEEIAAHICFWLSDDSAPANGQCYEVEQFPLIGRLNPPRA